MDRGDLLTALPEIEQGRRETEGRDPVQDWRFRLLQEEVLLWQGKLASAPHLLDSPPPELASSSQLLIHTKLAQSRAPGNSQNAAVLVDEAEHLARTSDPELLGEINLAKGSLAFGKHAYAAAQDDFKVALQFARQYHQPLLEAKALGSLARLSTSMGRYDQGIDWGTASLSICQSTRARHIEAVTRLNIGWSYLELGDFQQAIPMFKESEALSADAGLDRYRQEALNSLGRISMNQGNFEEAETSYKRALALAQGRQDQASISNYLNNLSMVATYRGKLDEAENYVHQALAAQRKTDDPVIKLNCLLALAWLASKQKRFDTAQDVVQTILRERDTPESIHWEAESILADVELAKGQSKQAQVHYQRVLDQLSRARSSIRQDERRLAFSAREAAFYNDYIHFLVDHHDPVGALQVSEQMRARTLEEALTKAGARPTSLSAVQSFLRARGEVILAYWLASDDSYLWAITPSQFKIFTLPAKPAIEARIESYDQRVSSLGNIEPVDAAGQELYRILVEQAHELIPPKAQVVIIPDGGLEKLNFETLIVPQPSPHFWIDDVQIEDASSIALLVNSRSSRRTAAKLLAIGDPVEVTSDYPRLEYAHQEMEAVTAQFPANARTIVIGPDATPASYASHKPGQFDIIHFAAHAFASETQPLDSAIVLSKQADGDFKLYARDIVKTPLKAEIVIVSACYGAGKRTYSGEGLVGLAWAFLRAGAHRVVAGLWNVEDQPTLQLMRDFYAGLTHGRSAAAALRDAKLKMLHSGEIYRYPYYWASLQLYVGS